MVIFFSFCAGMNLMSLIEAVSQDKAGHAVLITLVTIVLLAAAGFLQEYRK